ncbi:NAD(P)-dependent dehydrogenase, short-chain alcohol dehydrogenase family [Fontimonas thermophila]|uniref:NAD(P)-dependent dehydrogenase, short-chain alcohol dehydrogenase family n=1 Tax=Fontimonas thermophila TaxID=1076937 RepID=A0A1I2KCX0_9GAMM|nr:SDR family oxidoreductase [Fontimonas thermophila]SFF64303.1 NAD(P)-dependent dehydrogenase, short-chain alcohol dehydrogenase family [Fontimonas thermophila]
MARLSGRIALVTGAGQGVGQGIAFALAAEGAAVAVAGRTRSKLDATVAEIEARGGRALAVECNVRDAASLASCVDRVVRHFGGLNILVNNAQEVPLGTLDTVTDEAFIAGWESGPLATFRLMKLCHPYLKGGGCIINFGSSAAKRWDLAGYGAYAAVKEAIRQLTRAAACEWARDGIRTNAILPLADSPAMQGWTRARPQEAAAFIATIPQGRVGDCEDDIGRFVVALCSDDCRYINGQSIGVDGGQAYLG